MEFELHFVFIPWRIRDLVSRISSDRFPADGRQSDKKVKNYKDFNTIMYKTIYRVVVGFELTGDLLIERVHDGEDASQLFSSGHKFFVEIRRFRGEEAENVGVFPI